MNGKFRFRSNCRRVALISSTILANATVVPAYAQLAPPAPLRQTVDNNGVDLFNGTATASGPVMTMGAGAGKMSYQAFLRGGVMSNTALAWIDTDGSTWNITFKGNTDQFTTSAGVFINSAGNGNTLSLSGNTYTYILRNGTTIHFSKLLANASPYYGQEAIITDINYSNGLIETYVYDTASDTDGSGNTSYWRRLNNVYNSLGIKLSLNYYSTNFINPQGQRQYYNWVAVIGATLSDSNTSATVSQVQGVATDFGKLTDALGRTTNIQLPFSQIISVTRPANANPDVTYAYSGSVVTSATTAGGTTNYTTSDLSGVRTVTATDSSSNTTTYKFDIASSTLSSVLDAAGNQTTYSRDTFGRITQILFPEGNATQYAYDGRGNITTTTNISKTPGTPTNIQLTASFPATCTSPVSCNKPTWSKDAYGNETDYYYTSTGDPLSVVAPAPSSGAARPTTTFGYTSVAGVTLLNASSICSTAATCTGTVNETKTSIAYDGNGWATSVTKGAGDGSLSATNTYTYDATGNVTSVDGPLAGSADTTTYRYDADREVVGVISADPDGTGSLQHRALRLTYNGNGDVSETEVGTVAGTDDSSWAGFSSSQQALTSYDGFGRQTLDTLTAGGTTYSVSQYSYDSAGRLDCSAVRMNSAVWGSLPSACTAQATGAAGPDRIIRNVTYDRLNRIVSVAQGYGTPGVAIENTGYTPNGKTASAQDANGNLTNYAYDGLDRLSTTTYVGGSYEQLSYDANSNVTSRRLRDGQSIGYVYDNLSRITQMTLPGTGIDLPINYMYDLQGRLLTSSNTVGHLTNYTYDALGRMSTEQTTYGGVKTSTYDAAGRRVRLTWPDGFYVIYDYDTLGEMVAVRENGATSGIGVLATYTYNDLGRRTGLYRGNGTSTIYGYDTASRLTSLGLDLGGTSYDQTLAFSYNSANQIVSRAASNDTYAFTGAASHNDGSTINGLNQVASVAGSSIGYDARGNLNTTVSASYGYSARNQLYTYATGNLYYDPPGRLDLIYDNSNHTTLDYDGDRLSTEGTYGGAAVVRRYVHGAGTDEPLVEYDASGNRTWLTADERGSIVARSNDSGTVTAINTYDEYGVPGTGNVGRFQYTGQAYLAELGVYYYKARMYSSRLGRFMQTDPVGYSDGTNWYAYVDGDPVNGIDPTGLDDEGTTVVTGSRMNGGGSLILPAGSIKFVNPVAAIPNQNSDSGGPDIVVTAKKQNKPPQKTQPASDRCHDGVGGPAPIPPGYVSADNAKNQIIRKAGTPISTPPITNPNWSQRSIQINWRGVAKDLSGITTNIMLSMTGGEAIEVLFGATGTKAFTALDMSNTAHETVDEVNNNNNENQTCH